MTIVVAAVVNGRQMQQSQPMKFLRYLLGFSLFIGVCSEGFAQQKASPTPKPNMVLLDQGDDGNNVRPVEMLKKFFAGVKSGRLDDALDAITANSLLAHKPEDIETLKKGTQQALEKYGDVEGFEILEQKSAGESLFRITCVSLGEDMPLRWKFYFYKTHGTWRLLDMRVDTGIVDLFEDVGRNK